MSINEIHNTESFQGEVPPLLSDVLTSKTLDALGIDINQGYQAAVSADAANGAMIRQTLLPEWYSGLNSMRRGLIEHIHDKRDAGRIEVDGFVAGCETVVFALSLEPADRLSEALQTMRDSVAHQCGEESARSLEVIEAPDNKVARTIKPYATLSAVSIAARAKAHCYALKEESPDKHEAFQAGQRAAVLSVATCAQIMHLDSLFQAAA